MKRLKVKAVLSADRRTFDLHVITLTHTDDSFGGEQEHLLFTNYPKFVFMHKDIMLAAYTVPHVARGLAEAWRGPYSHIRYTVMFAPNKEKTANGTNIVKDIPAEEWPLIREAIEAYNEFYKDR